MPQGEEHMSKEAIAIKALEVLARLGNGDKYGNSTGNTIARTALAEISRLAEQPAPVQEPVLKPLSKKWKWVLHESFADVAGFDEEGIPSFYWKESVNKFKSGELSAPCKGKNCGSLNGWLHSSECRAEHEAQYTTPPAAAQPEQEPVDKLPSGFVPLQKENGRIVYAACMDSNAMHYKWLMWRHPDGQWVSKRKLENWEVMQVEDQEHYGIVQDKEKDT
jgi:hypothetical protein